MNQKGNTTLIMMLFVMLVAILAGGYYFLQTQGYMPAKYANNYTMSPKVEEASAGATTYSALEAELNSVDTSEGAGDLTAVDQDLQSL